MRITKKNTLRVGILSVVVMLCIAIVAIIFTGIGHFKVGSQLAAVNQVSNLSHLLVRQQAKLFSLLLVQNAENEELVDALDTFSKEEFVMDATLYSTSGVLIAQSNGANQFQLDQGNEQNINTQQIVEPILSQQELIGFLRVTLDTQYGQITQNKINALFHLLYGELIILFLAGGLFVSCFFYFKRRNLANHHHTKIAPRHNPSQRFHSRRRAFMRK
ncbi:YtjB family periplasmic protein [Otariodibacter oris]|uniref:Membrane protein n=1 Tax=Otariodibacter oris TaxID=1032623 RepID=A0A420XEW0_9PAST|nr:YtjB family periplasmic protein [Otariodibacter oris]QGM81389.1 hemolysin regulation protein AhpA [Otariodibacter oris]RKR70797.1 membrane protein [Otariodibacter oris]